MPDWLLPSAPGKFTWRMLATVLAGQAIVIFFGALVARGLSAAAGRGDAHAATSLWIGSALALLAVVAAGLMRRGRAGVLLGWVVQIATIAAGVVVGSMFVVGVIFLVLWLYCLRSGDRIDRAQRSLG